MSLIVLQVYFLKEVEKYILPNKPIFKILTLGRKDILFSGINAVNQI